MPRINDSIPITKKEIKIVKLLSKKISKGFVSRSMGYTGSGTQINYILKGRIKNLPPFRYERLMQTAKKEGII